MRVNETTNVIAVHRTSVLRKQVVSLQAAKTLDFPL